MARFVTRSDGKTIDLDKAMAESYDVDNKKIKTITDLEVKDIQIGAVEIKDATTDTRQKVKSDGTDNTAVVMQNSQPLPTGAATSANQLPDGHNVIVDNGTGSSAVNIQDGGNSITVDGTVTAIVDTSALATSDNQTNGTQKTKITNGTDDVGVIDANGEKGLVTISPGHISTSNSTSTPLSADGVFTGEAEDVTNFGVIIVTVKSDVASVTDGLSIQQSTDGTNWDCTDVFTIPADTSKVFSFQTCARYFRVVYTNGGSDQTYLRLQTIIKPYYVKPSSHRINDAIIGEDDAELVKAVITGLAPDGTFKNVLVTNSGNQKISIEEFENDVSSNNNTQLNVTSFHSDGTEGNLITGIDYVSGKSGIDFATETLQTIEYEHHEIHSGTHYFICDYDSSINSGDTIEFVITTPNTLQWTHMLFDFASSLGATLDIYEGSSNVVGGTTVTIQNNNRNSNNSSSLTILSNPTSITDGTKISGYLVGGNRSGGFNNRDREIILEQNTIYLFRFTSLANSNTISYCGEWYEHTNKN